MILKSFSKINLSLSVTKKLRNGLHDVQSYFCLINLFDQIKIKKIKSNKDLIKFKGKFAKYIKKKNNSITNTLEILRKKKLISDFYSIQVNKKIPVFAGLGGGTGNAVTIIKYFAKNKLNKGLLNIFEKKIGSDLKLFLYNQGFLKNLKQINKFKRKFKLIFLLVYPNIKISTKFAYSKVKKYSFKKKHNFNKISNKKKFINFILDKNNDLQKILEKKYPSIMNLLKEIDRQEGCYFARMTGSGSVCYGVFQNERNAKAALTKIKKKYPKFWVWVAKTI